MNELIYCLHKPGSEPGISTFPIALQPDINVNANAQSIAVEILTKILNLLKNSTYDEIQTFDISDTFVIFVFYDTGELTINFSVLTKSVKKALIEDISQIITHLQQQDFENLIIQ